jgi:amino acid transporter
MAIAAVISCAGGLAVQMLVTPRNFYALGESGDLPLAIVSVHPTWRTPWVAILATALVSWALAITGTFQYLLGLFVISRMLAHGSTAAALIVLRRREGPAPLRIPAGVVISVLAVAACIALAVLAPLEQVRDVAIVVAAGFLVRALVRSRAARSTVRPGGTPP